MSLPKNACGKYNSKRSTHIPDGKNKHTINYFDSTVENAAHDRNLQRFKEWQTFREKLLVAKSAGDVKETQDTEDLRILSWPKHTQQKGHRRVHSWH